MAALSASRLVCSATLLITSSTVPMLWVSWFRRWMLVVVCSIAWASWLIRSRVWRTTWLPVLTRLSAASVELAAASALRATSCTVAAISLMAVATWSVSSFWPFTPTRVCSVTLDSAWAEAEICATPPCRRPTMSRRLADMPRMASISWPISSRRCTSMLALRSPSAICCARPMTRRSGRTISRLISTVAASPISSASAAASRISSELDSCCASMSAFCSS
ncbi:hypothetical protein D9M72_499880 [compost metagenome]